MIQHRLNYGMPEDSDTYLHPVACAGCFGTKDLAITFVSEENDAKVLNDIQDRFEVNVTELLEESNISTYGEQSPDHGPRRPGVVLLSVWLPVCQVGLSFDCPKAADLCKNIIMEKKTPDSL